MGSARPAPNLKGLQSCDGGACYLIRVLIAVLPKQQEVLFTSREKGQIVLVRRLFIIAAACLVHFAAQAQSDRKSVV